MGWASGSRLLDEVAEIVMPCIPRAARPQVAKELIEAFRGDDCDTIDECEQEDIAREWERQNRLDET